MSLDFGWLGRHLGDIRTLDDGQAMVISEGKIFPGRRAMRTKLEMETRMSEEQSGAWLRVGSSRAERQVGPGNGFIHSIMHPSPAGDFEQKNA